MIVLLSIGEALIAQARDEKLVGGGTVTVLPEGLDVEVMKTGGLGGLFFSIHNARFVYLQLLASPRLADRVSAVAPQIDGKLLYLRTMNGTERPVRASGEIPSAMAAVGAASPLAAGEWTDDDGDRRWARPTAVELRHSIDHFHVPASTLPDRESWGEWHYFNIVSADRRRWAFVSLIVAGDVTGSRWGGQSLVTVHEEGRAPRRFTAVADADDVRFSLDRVDLRIGDDSVALDSSGSYLVRVTAREEGGRGDPLVLDLRVTPTPRAYFPGSTIESGDFTSGYTVPGLRADGSGSLCIAGRCEQFDNAQSYHDHNWGVWQGVSWEWGTARLGEYAVLFGRVQPPDSLGGDAPLFVYLVDSLGFLAVFRPRAIQYVDDRPLAIGGTTIRVPSRGVMSEIRGADTLRLELFVEDAVGTDTRARAAERGESANAPRALRRPYFIQMKGRARVSGRVGGVRISGDGTGFFETYR